MSDIIGSVEYISRTEGYAVEDVQRGYTVFDVDGVLVIQKIDCLEVYGAHKFDCDTAAGKQAMKDGHSLLISDHEDYKGWYLVDTEDNRKALDKLDVSYRTAKEACI